MSCSYLYILTEYVQGTTTIEWELVDVANQNQRGTFERMRRKLVRIRESICQEVAKPHDTTSTNTVMDAELQHLGKALRISEMRKKEVQQDLLRTKQELQCRDKQFETTVKQHESTIQSLQTSLEVSKQQLVQSECHWQQALKRAEQAEQREDAAEKRAVIAEERATLAEERVSEAKDKLQKIEMQWIVQKEEIQLTSMELGRGGWAVVKVAEFRGTQVAAKCFYRELRSKYYEQMFAREMEMASRLRHPNLVQFIGATSLVQGEPIILTELMMTSLRELLKAGPIDHPAIVSISLDVARALNYLHLMNPQPLIHRDISSANILLDPIPNKGWKAKVSDYGSVNLVQKLQTVGPGSPVYAAPEATFPVHQSSKMDIFSFGILLVEMLTDQFPEVENRRQLIASIDHSGFTTLIKQCLDEERDKRPSAKEVLSDLSNLL